MTVLASLLSFIFRGGAVKRYHTQPTLKEQSVAEHSAGVAWMVYLLTDGSASRSLILSALAHDLAEHRVGDVPSPTKRRIPGLADALAKEEDHLLELHDLVWELTGEEARILKLADYLEGMLYCVKERSLGNKNIAEVYDNFYDYAQPLCERPTEMALYGEIHNLWRNQ